MGITSFDKAYTNDLGKKPGFWVEAFWVNRRRSHLRVFDELAPLNSRLQER